MSLGPLKRYSAGLLLLSLWACEVTVNADNAETEANKVEVIIAPSFVSIATISNALSTSGIPPTTRSSGYDKTPGIIRMTKNAAASVQATKGATMLGF